MTIFIGEGENLYDKFIRREQRKEIIDMRDNKIPKLKEKMIWKELGSELVESGTAVREISKKTGTDPNEIAQVINKLIDKEHVVSSKARKSGKVFIQRNPFNAPK